jgi:MFS transporter, DHA3 family, macrolide efflux protein
MNKDKRLWNRNFTILWQGQLISDFGNVAFSVALGFWVLDVTKSTAMMGAILACFSLPGVLLGPFAGAVADRLNRKWIIVLSDFARGVLYTLMGLTVLFKVFPFYMIFPLAILVGICGAFFSPAISSVLPDIVATDNLSKANSARGFSSTFTQLAGNSFSGLMYSLLTAPVMILINGLSFLYSSITQLFMKIPTINKDVKKTDIFHDMVEGARYSFGNRGVRTLIFTGMFLNFFAVVGITLMTPLFKQEPSFGVAMYGYVMGTMMAGALAGMLLLSVVKIKPAIRSLIFCGSILVMAGCMIPMGMLKNVVWMFPLAFITGLTNAVINVMLQTIMQVTIPAANRGKVFGILGTVMGGLQPIAMAISGVVAQFVGVRPTIVGAFILMTASVVPMLLDRHFKEFISTDTNAPDTNAGSIAEAVPAAE